MTKKATTKEICICAAIITTDGSVIRGHRHGDAIIVALRMRKRHECRPENQGFITSKNRYVTREKGRKLQDAAGIKSVDKEGYKGKTLYSEDLY